jgi:hypothetical protein
MFVALTNQAGYRSMHNLTSDAAFLALADVDGDHSLTNLDIQSLLYKLNPSGGMGHAVPEPASIVLGALSLLPLLFCARLRRRRQAWSWPSQV